MNNAEIPFLRQAPVINMVPLQEATVFIGEIVVERPDFHEMLNMHHFMMNPEQQVMKMIQKAMQRKGSSVEWIGFVADLEGVIAIIEFKKPMILGAAKTIVGHALSLVIDSTTTRFKHTRLFCVGVLFCVVAFVFISAF